MTSYARSNTVVTDIQQVLDVLHQTTTVPESLQRLLNSIRQEMEIPAQAGGIRTFGGGGSAPSQGWRSGGGGGGNSAFGGRGQRQTGPPTGRRPDSFHTGSPRPQTGAPSTGAPVGRYQSRFKATSSSTNLDNKILNTVIGNRLNAFTALTYNDTRDFIYQIMDSGETEFIKDFVEKVFKKATVEELYCGLFAKLIAEIAHKYPVMYEEMAKRHEAFLEVFEDVQEGGGEGSVQARAYRLGYGQFISELAGKNALEREQLFAMVSKVMEKVWVATAEQEKSRQVEEYVDCLVRLTQSLGEKSPKFFGTVKRDLSQIVLEKARALIAKTAGDRPSLTSKSRCALMDLVDLLK